MKKFFSTVFRILKYLFLILLVWWGLDTLEGYTSATELRSSGEAAVKWVASLYKSGDISLETAQGVADSVMTYDRRGIVLSYLTFLIALVVWAILAYITDEGMNPDRVKPVTIKEAYLKWLKGLPFGLGGALLSGGTPESQDSPEVKSFWDAMSLASLFGTPLLALFNWRDISYYWTAPELFFYAEWGISKILLSIYLLYHLVILPIAIPHLVRRFNANWFRRNYENQDILDDKPTRVVRHVEQIGVILPQVDASVEAVNACLRKGIDYDQSIANDFIDKVGLFFSNLFTGGDYERMVKENIFLQELRQNYEPLQAQVLQLDALHSALIKDLDRMRKAAARNLYLYKEILNFLPQEVKGREIVVREDKVGSFMKDVGLDTRLVDAVSEQGVQVSLTVDANLEGIFVSGAALAKFAFTNDLSNAQNKGRLLEATVATAMGALSSILSMNGDVERQRQLIQDTIQALVKAIAELQNAIPAYQASMARISEVVTALDACNKVFVKMYTPLNAFIFKPNSEELTQEFLDMIEYMKRKNNPVTYVDSLLALTKELSSSLGQVAGVQSSTINPEERYEKFMTDIANLKLACSEYNRINQNTHITE